MPLLLPLKLSDAPNYAQIAKEYNINATTLIYYYRDI
jgi:hypothetical protein